MPNELQESLQIVGEMAERAAQGLDPLPYTELDFETFCDMRATEATDAQLQAYFCSPRYEFMDRRWVAEFCCPECGEELTRTERKDRAGTCDEDKPCEACRSRVIEWKAEEY